MGGPGFDVFEPNTNYVKVYTPKQTFGPAEWRRMVYQEKPRMRQDATFGEFDCPDSSQPMARRNVSTTALQALEPAERSVHDRAGRAVRRTAASAKRPATPAARSAARSGWPSAARPSRRASGGASS